MADEWFLTTRNIAMVNLQNFWQTFKAALKQKKSLLLLLVLCVCVLIFEEYQVRNQRKASKSTSSSSIDGTLEIFPANENLANGTKAPSQRRRQDDQGSKLQLWQRVSSSSSSPTPRGGDWQQRGFTTPVTDDRENMYAARRLRVQEVCLRHREIASYGGLEFAPVSKLRFHKKRNMMVCITAKVGSSTWLEYLLRDARLHFDTKNDFSGRVQASSYFAPEENFRDNMEENLSKFVKIANARHPFDRLVSAYRNKIENCHGGRRCKFVKRHLPTNLQSNVNFTTFVKNLLETVPADTEATESTFRAFNQHWRPYYINCAVCDIDYDYIVKMETWDEDMRYILGKLGFDQKEQFHANNNNSSSVASDYIKALPRSVILELYHRYRLDFDMFGYTLHKFLN